MEEDAATALREEAERLQRQKDRQREIAKYNDMFKVRAFMIQDCAMILSNRLMGYGALCLFDKIVDWLNEMLTCMLLQAQQRAEADRAAAEELAILQHNLQVHQEETQQLQQDKVKINVQRIRIIHVRSSSMK